MQPTGIINEGSMASKVM